MAWDIDDLLGVPEGNDVDTKPLQEALALTRGTSKRNLEITWPAEQRILNQVNKGVGATDFGAQLDEITDYAQRHALRQLQQNQMTQSRMGVDLSEGARQVQERTAKLGTGLAGVNTRNLARMDMHENRLTNMARAIGQGDFRLGEYLKDLEAQQQLNYAKAGIPQSGGFSLGDGLKSAMAGYLATGNPVAAGIYGVLGAFF